MSLRSRTLLLFLTGSLLFLALPIVVSPDLTRHESLFAIPGFQRELLLYVLLLAFFYLNYFLLIPALYLQRKYALFTGILLLCFAAVAVLPDTLIGHRQHPLPAHAFPGPPPNFRFLEVSHRLFMFLVVVFFSLVLRISLGWRQTREEKLNAELAYLKAQINPHFLFNMLNSIYSLALEKSDRTAGAIVQLSEMMRYVMNENEKHLVDLDREIGYINSYVELQRLRLRNTVTIDYLVHGPTAGKLIAPLMLIPFIENAFKHGVNPEEQSAITIHISTTGHMLMMMVANNKVQVQPATYQSTGLGIRNTGQRLEHLYPGRYEKVIEETEQSYRLFLKLNLA